MKPAVRLDELKLDAKLDSFGHILPEAANGPIVTQTAAQTGWLARIDRGLGWLVEVRLSGSNALPKPPSSFW